jgi:hypothetical protein
MFSFLLRPIPLTADHQAIAIRVGLRTGNHGRNPAAVEAADALKEIDDLLVLDAELGRVSEVLILAAAASPEVTARRLDALRRGREDPQQFCASETFLYFGDLGFDLFAVRDERNEHHEILPARDALAAEGDVFDFQIQFLAGRQLHEPNLEICVP